MSGKLISFNNGQFACRVVERDGAPWFVAKDICDAMCISNSRDKLASLDSDEKGVAVTDTPGGPQEVAIISESGLYALVFQSRKPEARAFSKWVRAEVLPAISRTGSFAGQMGMKEMFLAAARAIEEKEQAEALAAEARQEASAAAALAQVAKEKAIKAEARAETSRDYANGLERFLLDNSGALRTGRRVEKERVLLSAQEAANVLRQTVPGFVMGGTGLFNWLREQGLVVKRGKRGCVPTRKGVESGIVWLRKRTYKYKGGKTVWYLTSGITAIGLEKLTRYFGRGCLLC